MSDQITKKDIKTFCLSILAIVVLAGTVLASFFYAVTPNKGEDLEAHMLTKYVVIARPEVMEHPFCKRKKAIFYEGKYMDSNTVELTVRCEDQPSFKLLLNIGRRW
ncbi:hypothetical protein [Neptuniibacter sp. QD37_11]|uniref:hypothetical protein n=1 Tax=Neptuniibacter sp. QD37_11 TaxID=3398209 RepID=UPI0039F60E79